jgi:hypothetical protein
MADWQRLAWNGLALSVPRDWELTALGMRHLVLADGAGVIMECKWNRVTGRFDLDRHLRKLAKTLGALDPMEPPPAWRPALGSFTARVFRLADGCGALLFCPQCRTASLVRFAGAAASETETPARVLASLACHFADGCVPWQVFGFAAHTPAAYALTRHRLTPGRYELVLDAGSSRLTLASLGPADVLLAGNDLAAWSRKTFTETIARHRLQPMASGPSLSWRARREPTFLRRLFLRLRREPTRGGLIVRHDPAANRLFCLEARGREPLDWKMLEATGAALGAVQT